MAINNRTYLTGNISKPGIKVIENTETRFGVFSLATTDSYMDKSTNQWKNREPVWHEIKVFDPKMIDILLDITSKDRIKVQCSLNYQNFPVTIEVSEDGEVSTKTIQKKEASLIARKVEAAPLLKKK